MRYEGSEFEAMAQARNYYRWILACCRGHLGAEVVEIGAGIGTFSTFLLETGIERLVAVEPAANLVPALEHRLARWGARVTIVTGSLEQAAPDLERRNVDTVIGVNVLEHIQDDVATLDAAWRVLRPRGALILFVPALPWLYGSLDRTFQHVRRYRRDELGDKVAGAGFDVLWTRFMNLPGIVPWWVSGRLLRRRTLDARSVAIYDRLAIPIIACLERVLPPPLGQSLLLVGRKAPRRP